MMLVSGSPASSHLSSGVTAVPSNLTYSTHGVFKDLCNPAKVCV